MNYVKRPLRESDFVEGKTVFVASLEDLVGETENWALEDCLLMNAPYIIKEVISMPHFNKNYHYNVGSFTLVGKSFIHKSSRFYVVDSEDISYTALKQILPNIFQE